jgi:phosphoserine aminotransferase
MPKIFRLTKGGKLIDGIFRGETINTPSMLALEDYIDALTWSEEIGGLEALKARANANAKVLNDWMDKTDWVSNLAVSPEIASNTSVCLKITDPQIAGLDDDAQAAFAKRMVKLLDEEDAAKDIGSYRDAPAGLRIWAGATVEKADLEALLPWLEWAFGTAKAELA